MFTLIIGGSGSGKSAYAEHILETVSDVKNKYYLATMQVFDEDGKRKIERHRRLRRGKGFLTIEQSVDVERAVRRLESEDSAVLLECMSNLTANEMFGSRSLSAEETAEKVRKGIGILKTAVRHLVIVSNNVFEDGIRYDDGTGEYLRALARINNELAAEADRVIEVVVGLPVILKDADK